ncbi:MAG: ATPase, partial [Fimbriimonadaceae bacterium]|nr:ATPase [Alphaproteobacteria bacterium]
FTPEQGSIIIKARQLSGTVQIKIIDTGIGIPDHAIATLCRPFEQVQNQFTKNHEGTGLGLAISRSLVELHGGELQLESVEGQGTTVTVTLPAEPVLLEMTG